MTPPRMSLCTTDGTCNPFWQPRSVEGYNFIAPKPVEFKAADGTTTLLGTLLLPESGPMMANGKVPLILNPYGGPGAQSVRDTWGGATFLFDQILARQGFAVLVVDNRGMANRGKAFAAPVKHHLGPTELDDQMASLKQALAAVSAAGRLAAGLLGLELRRLLHALRAGEDRHVQDRSVRRSGDRLARLRFHLHRTLHGSAAATTKTATEIVRR